MTQGITIRLSAVLLLFLFTGNTAILAHGGEDHGDPAPQTTASTKGTVTHIARLGDIEVTLKHPELEPDIATSGRLFLTQFQTNVPIEGATAVIEFEGADGSVIHAVIEKTDDAGIFTVKVPALPQGTYTVRTGITTKGETDTATFSGVEVRTGSAGITASLYSWAKGLMGAMVFLFLATLFGVLIYLIMQTSVKEEIQPEQVSV